MVELCMEDVENSVMRRAIQNTTETLAMTDPKNPLSHIVSASIGHKGRSFSMSKRIDAFNRRRLIQASGLGAIGLMIGSRTKAQPFVPPSPIGTGHVENGKVKFPEWRKAADTPSSPPPAPLPTEQRVGFAIVGLGRLALEEILPALAQSMKAKPVELASGSPEKLRTVAAQYGIKPEACYS